MPLTAFQEHRSAGSLATFAFLVYRVVRDAMRTNLTVRRRHMEARGPHPTLSETKSNVFGAMPFGGNDGHVS